MHRVVTLTRIALLLPWLMTTVAVQRLRGHRSHPASFWREEVAVALLRATFRLVREVEPALLRKGVPTMPRFLLPHGVRNVVGELAGRPTETSTPPDWTPEQPTILYLHGGGYGICSPGTHRDLIARVAHCSGARCVALQYRLAPDHPYPAGLQDAHRAFLELLDQTPRERLFIAGDSAGGGLTVATLLALRDAGDPLPAGAFLLSPWVDHTHSGSTIETNEATDYLTKHMLETYSRNYLGDHDPRTPCVSPIFADLSGLPPLLVQAGEAEIMCAEIRTFAQRAGEAGVEVTFEVEPGAAHVHQSFAWMLPGSRAALKRAGRWMRARL
jgi:acetyl esterase/lipase